MINQSSIAEEALRLQTHGRISFLIEHFMLILNLGFHRCLGGRNVSHSKQSRVTVEIFNRSYTIIGEEDQQHLNRVAGLVNDKMREIKEKNRSLDTSRLAVLTAVNTMNDYLKLQKEYEQLKTSIKKEEE